MQKKYPFKFLDSYTREDKDFFFGRTDEIEDLYKMCFQSNILLVYGTSGTGKTSLIQCGLANKFQSYDWSSLFIRRGKNLIYALDKILCEETDKAFPAAAEKEYSIKNLTEKIESIYEVSLKPIYLIFDQFEELYILGNNDEQNGFFKVIREILSIKRPVKIIISIREEYLGHLYKFEQAVPELLRKKLRVEAMNLGKVTTVIEGIGNSKNSNISIEKGKEKDIATTIFEKLREDEKSNTIQLPYLQVFLDNLYMDITKKEYPTAGDETRKAEATISTEALNKFGNIGDVLRSFLVEQVSKTALKLEKPQEIIWRILSPFVTLQGTKNPIEKIEVFEILRDIPHDFIEKVIDVFVKSRILRLNENNQRYEITHDALAKQVNAHRSPEEIAILEVKRMIKNLVEAQKGKSRVFDEEQLAIIKQFRERIQLEPEEVKAIESSQQIADEEKRKEEEQKKIELAKARKRNRTLAGFLIVAILAFIAAGILLKIVNNSEKILFNTNKELDKKNDSLIISQQRTLNALKIADSAKVAANKSKELAQENLLKVYESEKSRYLKEKEILEKNIKSYVQYGAENDVIDDEKRKISTLNEKIKDLDQKMRKLRK